MPGTDDLREHSSRGMIQRLPEPPLGRCGPTNTPHFIHFDFTLGLDMVGGTRMRGWRQREVGGLKRGGLFSHGDHPRKTDPQHASSSADAAAIDIGILIDLWI